ncbi:MAG: hypothetical protein IT369_02265 [Candidatus Latescibacteria bacterium]|nr:hypothetical protein [Candidatus Latescibacterota bacterium]
MAEWLDFQVRLEGHWLWLALIPLALAGAYCCYRHTLPAVTPPLRWTLIALRSLAMALLLAVLAEIVVDWWNKQVVHPWVLVLVDTSASMGVVEEGQSRFAGAAAVLASPDFAQALSSARLAVWGFAEAPYALALDTLSQARVGGQATDLARALTKGLEQVADREQLAGVLLVSDGAHNLGEDPGRAAAEGGVPVYTVGVGSTRPPADVRIARAQATEAGYLGRPLRLEAELNSWGYAGREVKILLSEGDQLLDQQLAVLADGPQSLSFELRPTVAGPHIYQVEVAPLEGEVARDNNTALVFVQVLQERLKILLVGSGPSVDLAFVRRSLEADSSLVVDCWVEEEAGRFYQGKQLSTEVLAAAGALVLVDPGPGLMTAAGPLFAQYVQAGGGLLLVGGLRTWQSGALPPVLAGMLPVELAPGKGFVAQEVSLSMGLEGREHPVVRLVQEQEGTTADPWAQLPPLPGYLEGARRKEGAAVLVEGNIEGRPPLLVAGAAGRGKVIAGLSGSFWRLDLISSGVGGRPQIIRRFWQNAAKWLAMKTPAGRVRVWTERPIHRSGEGVAFAAQVFDELLRPQSGASVAVSLGGEASLQLQDQGRGEYRAVWRGLSPGEYSWHAQVQAGGSAIGSDEGHFVVEQHTLESANLQANPALLEEIARLSGGQYRPLAQWRQAIEQLNARPRLIQQHRTLAWWGPPWPLILAVVLLAAEWLLRKRSGML